MGLVGLSTGSSGPLAGSGPTDKANDQTGSDNLKQTGKGIRMGLFGCMELDKGYIYTFIRTLSQLYGGQLTHIFVRYSIPAYVLMDKELGRVGWAELGLARVRPSRWQAFEITSDLTLGFRTRKKALFLRALAGCPEGQIDRPNINLGPVLKGVKRKENL